MRTAPLALSTALALALGTARGAPASLATAAPGGTASIPASGSPATADRAQLGAVAERAAQTLAALRTARPDLYAARPEPRLGVWSERQGPARGAPLARLDSAGVATLEWLSTTLRGALDRQDPDDAWLARLAAETARVETAVARGDDPFAGRTGPMWMAYRSRLDGTPQPFGLVVPAGWTPAETTRTWRLHVGLHGLGSGPGRYLRELLGVPLRKKESTGEAEHEFPDGIALPNPTDFLVAPYGRGDLAFRGPGEDDVLSVIDAILERYPVDPRQVDLTGVSMGGIGVMELATHRPDIFQHAQALAGAADIRRFDSVRDKPVTPPEAAVLRSVAAIEWAENLWNLPLDAVHGTRDTAIDDDNTAILMDRLAALGSPDKSFARPALGHNVQDSTYANGAVWTQALPHRVDDPAHVVFVTGDLHYRAAYWVRVDHVERTDDFARLEATRDPSGAVDAVTSNVAGFTLRLDRAGDVRVDGQVVAHGVAGMQSFARRDGRWRRAALPDLVPPAGPIGANHLAPRWFVYGTADPAAEPVEQATAARLAAPSGMKGSAFVVVPDTAVTDVDIANHDLLVVGTPSSNRLLARIEAAARARSAPLPATVDPEGLTFSGVRYAGEVGAVYAVANPLAPDRGLTVYEGRPAALELARCLPRYLPDFVVYDAGIACTEAGNILDGRPVLASGFFPAAGASR